MTTGSCRAGELMTALEAQQEVQQDDPDRRRHQRVRVNLLGRCMFADQREFPCQLTNISPAGAAVMSSHCGEVGERVIAYVDHIGRLEGTITRHVEGGFVMSIAASLRKRDKLADTLTWLANRHVLNLPEERRHIRRSPKNAETMLILPDGSSHPARVIAISRTASRWNSCASCRKWRSRRRSRSSSSDRGKRRP
jgi:hypothetical protein